MSVGHVARAVEAAGIPTVSIFIEAFRHHAANMKLPRALVVHHPMGRPMGAANDRERHRLVLHRALALLQEAEAVGSMDVLEVPYRTTPAEDV